MTRLSRSSPDAFITERVNKQNNICTDNEGKYLIIEKHLLKNKMTHACFRPYCMQSILRKLDQKVESSQGVLHAQQLPLNPEKEKNQIMRIVRPVNIFTSGDIKALTEIYRLRRASTCHSRSLFVHYTATDLMIIATVWYYLKGEQNAQKWRMEA